MIRRGRTPEQSLACEEFQEAKAAYMAAMTKCFESFQPTSETIMKIEGLEGVLDFIEYEMPDMILKTLLVRKLHAEIDAAKG